MVFRMIKLAPTSKALAFKYLNHIVSPSLSTTRCNSPELFLPSTVIAIKTSPNLGGHVNCQQQNLYHRLTLIVLVMVQRLPPFYVSFCFFLCCSFAFERNPPFVSPVSFLLFCRDF